MKKLNLLTPILCASTLAGATTVITSCGCSKETTLSLNASQFTLKVGETVTITAATSSKNQVFWYSSDSTKVDVSNGLVTALALGSATITASVDGKNATCTIYVLDDASTPTENDIKYLNEINELMKFGKQYTAPHKAIEALKDNGYNVLTYKFANPNLEFAFDAWEKKFIIMYGDQVKAAPSGYTIENTQSVFKFTKTYDKNSKYGQYLLDDFVWDDPTEVFKVDAAIDVGNNTNIKNMLYVGNSANGGSTKLLRTYCEYLNINENNDTIYHMGVSNNVNVYGASSTKLCNYSELGRVAYLYVKNVKLQIAKLTTADQAQIDLLEVDEDGTIEIGDLFHNEFVTMFVGQEIEGTESQHRDTTSVGSLNELKTAISNQKSFVRLTAPITFDSSVQETITVTDRSFILDLGGQQLIDKSGIAEGDPLIDVHAENADSYLMFIDSYRQGLLTLNDHYIKVQGNVSNKKNTATLYLEGANIKYNVTADNRNGAVEVGVADTSSTGKQYSRVYMYGGVISAYTDSLTHDQEVAGIYANNDAYIQVVYGAIYSSTNCIRSNGMYSGSKIDIVDGTFKTNSNEVGECIYLPQGRLNITGGTFEGHTCLGMRGGVANISGGYFHATGPSSNIDKAGSGSGVNGDGSVICVELCGTASATAYSLNPSITVSNATLHSDNSYILQVFRDNDSQMRVINQNFEIDFFGGVYYYSAEIEEPTYNGVRIAKNDTDVDLTPYCRVYQQSGSWIKIDK